jgi:hypothetical protein
MNSSPFLAIGRRAPILRLRTKTVLKLGKKGRPVEWADVEMVKKQTIKVRVNFFRCPIVAKRLQEAGLPVPAERFQIPKWGERIPGSPLIRHKETGDLYLWCLGEGLEDSSIFAGDKDITNDGRLPLLLGRPATSSVPSGMMTFVLRLDSIEEMEEVK